MSQTVKKKLPNGKDMIRISGFPFGQEFMVDVRTWKGGEPTYEAVSFPLSATPAVIRALQDFYSRECRLQAMYDCTIPMSAVEKELKK